eukprot:gene12140-2745_t
MPNFDQERENSFSDQEICSLESSEATLGQSFIDDSEGQRVFNTSAVHQGPQTVYDKYILGAQIETMILRNKTTVSHSDDKADIQLNTMSPELILKDKKKAKNYAQQGNVYSSYKHHTTFKALIAVTPNGAACFVSDLYEGSIDDVSITKKCGIIDHIEHEDVVLMVFVACCLVNFQPARCI